MGVFDRINGKSKKKIEMVTTHFYPDLTFNFEKKEVYRSFAVDREGGEIKRGWCDIPELRKDFYGYGNLPASQVLLIQDNDLIIDTHNSLTEVAKKDAIPEPGEGLNSPFFANIAETTRNEVDKWSKKMTTLDKLIMIEGICLGIMVLGLVFKWATTSTPGV